MLTPAPGPSRPTGSPRGLIQNCYGEIESESESEIEREIVIEMEVFLSHRSQKYAFMHSARPVAENCG